MAKSARATSRGKSRPEKVKIDDSRVEIISPGRLAPSEWKAIAATAAVGLSGGWLASMIIGGSGLLRYLVTGVLGAFLGGLIMRETGWRLTVGHPVLDRILVAAIGAMLVVLLAKMLA